jgi:hypothetical protein
MGTFLIIQITSYDNLTHKLPCFNRKESCTSELKTIGNDSCSTLEDEEEERIHFQNKQPGLSLLLFLGTRYSVQK